MTQVLNRENSLSGRTKTLAGSLANMASQFRSAGSGALSFAMRLNPLPRIANSVSNRIHSMAQRTRMSLMMIKSIVFSMLLMNLFKVFSEGFGNLAKKSDSFNNSFSKIYSSLIYLKNAIVSAFAPLVNYVAPMVSSVINSIAGGFNKLAEFIAKITGQKSYEKAVYVQKDYRDSLDDTADSTSKANKEAEKYKKTLAGFDEITKLDSQKDNSNTNSGSSSDGTDGWTTETVNISSDAISDGNWYSVGQKLAEKFNGMFGSIDWDSIQNNVNEKVRKVVSGINGFVDNLDWKLMGQTVAQGFITVLGGLDTAFKEFHWKEFGKGIGDSIEGFFGEKPLTKLGTTIKDFVDGAFTALDECFKNETMWENIGKDIAGFMNELFSVDWGKVSETLSDGLSGIFTGTEAFFNDLDAEALAKGISDFVTNIKWTDVIWKAFKAGFSFVDFVSRFTEELQNAFYTKWENLGKDLATKLWEKITGEKPDQKKVDKMFSALKTAWILLNPTMPIWTKLESAKKIGEKLKGVIDNVKKFTISIGAKIGTKAKELWNSLKNAWNKIKDKAFSVAVKIGTSASNLWKNFKKKVTNAIGTGISVSIKFVDNLKTYWNNAKKWINTNIIDSLNNKFKVSIPKNHATEFLGINGTHQLIKLPKFNTYKQGGFPDGEDGFFYANHNEMVGTFSNGKTAVANNDQIVSGISNGVYGAVVRAFSEIGTTKNNNQSIHVYIGNKEITDFVIKDVNNRTIANGRCPILV